MTGKQVLEIAVTLDRANESAFRARMTFEYGQRENSLKWATDARQQLDRAIALLTPKPVTLREWPKTVPEGRWEYHCPRHKYVWPGVFDLRDGVVAFVPDDPDDAGYVPFMPEDFSEGEYFQRIEGMEEIP